MDYWFPFEYKEWLVSTSDMPADVRGWYINLLCHQADKGDLPTDMEDLATLAGVKISEYERFKQQYNQWLHQKFNQMVNGRLQNKKLGVILERRNSTKEKKTNSAMIAVFIKKKRKEVTLEETQWKQASTGLMALDIDYLNKNEIYQKYSEWFTVWLNQMVNHTNNNSNSNYNSNDKGKGGVGEKPTDPELLALEVVRDEVANAYEWQFGLCRDYQLSAAELNGYLEKFYKEIWNDGEREKTVKDYKKHFHRWLKGKLNKKRKSESDNEPEGSIEQTENITIRKVSPGTVIS